MPGNKRWTREEQEVLVQTLNKGTYTSLGELLNDLSNVLESRTVAAIHSRINHYHRDMLDNAFISKQERLPLGELKEQPIAKDAPAEEVLDSRLIFELYEKLSDFTQLVDSLKEENAQLLEYYHRSEKEIERLTQERNNAILEMNRTIEHLKNIKQMVNALSSNEHQSKERVAV